MDPSLITGLILAGGRGSRMGGTDKGLQHFRGAPLALHAMLRLGPQVGPLLINANRNLGVYEGFGIPVIPDSVGDYAGPLAGMLAGLEACDTEWMATVPCDSPLLPADLVDRLADAALASNADLAVAVTLEPRDGGTQRQPHPVFSLMQSRVLPGLTRFLHGGGRKIDAWYAGLAVTEVVFDDALAFANVNTLAELQQLERQGQA